MRFGEKLTSVGEGENLKSVGEMRFRDVGEAFSGLAVDVDEWGWTRVGGLMLVRMNWLSDLGGEGGVTLEYGRKRKKKWDFWDSNGWDLGKWPCGSSSLIQLASRA